LKKEIPAKEKTISEKPKKMKKNRSYAPWHWIVYFFAHSPFWDACDLEMISSYNLFPLELKSIQSYFFLKKDHSAAQTFFFQPIMLHNGSKSVKHTSWLDMTETDCHPQY